MNYMCPDCGTTLMNHGAGSRGDGDIWDEWYCNDCHCVKYRVHAAYCACQDCVERGCGQDMGERYVERVFEEADPSFSDPY